MTERTADKSPEALIKVLNKDSREYNKLKAATKLTELARSETGRKSIIKAGAIGALIKLLSLQSRDLRVTASHAICNIAISKSAHAEISRNGGIPLLVRQILTGAPDEVSAGGFALANLARVNKLAIMILDEVGGVPCLASLIKEWNHSNAREPCGDLLLKLSLNSGIEDKVANNGGIEAMVALLKDDELRRGSKEKALGALYNVCSTSQSFCKRAVTVGAVRPVTDVMLNGTANGQFSALLMTKAFIINGFENLVVDAGGVEAVVRLMDADLSALQHAEPANFTKEVAKTLYELSVGREDVKEMIAETGVIPKLVGLLDVQNQHLRAAVLRVLYGLAVCEKAKREIIKYGASKKLIAILLKNGKDSEYAATAVRNLVFDNDATARAMVREGSVPALLVVLQQGHTKEARKQALAALVNLSNEPASGGPESICSQGGVKIFAQEVAGNASSRVHEEFQWAAWCGVVLHNLMEYEDCLQRVWEAVSKESSKNIKLQGVTDSKLLKKWLSDLAADSDLEYL